MINESIKDIVNQEALNTLVHKKIEIDENLSVYIMIDSLDSKIIQPVLNKIIDFVLDNINGKNVYDSFLVVLEGVNAFLKTLENQNLNIFVTIIENNKLHFSRIWNICCYLINSKQEFIELTDKTFNKLFDDISSWNLWHSEKIIISNKELLDIITNSEALEISALSDINAINESLNNIIWIEWINDNLKIITLEYENEYFTPKDNKNKFDKVKYCFYKACDNFLVKKIIAWWLVFKDHIDKKSKLVKNIIFFSWIAVSTLLLFLIISSIIWNTIETSKKSQARTDLINAREYMRLAWQNINNKEAFNLNMKNAETILEKVKSEKIFLNDVESVYSDLKIVKRQFNGIQSFSVNTDNLVFKWEFKEAIKLIEFNKKQYVITSTSILGPILPGQQIKTNIFGWMEATDKFIDAWVSWENIILSTKNNRVVSFSTDGTFKYVNVIGQDKWINMSRLDTFNSNIYLVNQEKNQIFMHSPSLGNFNTWKSYLKNEDSKVINILDFAIDWWIYILKNDLSLIKFFSSPYRIESIVLNNLPNNYSFEGQSRDARIMAPTTSNYIFMSLNGRILVFKPNTKSFKDTKYLDYLGQLEPQNEKIKSFYVPRDWEIFVLTESWIYKVNFEVNEENKIQITK